MIKRFKQVAAWLLALSMTVTLTPAAAFATEEMSGASGADAPEQAVGMSEDEDAGQVLPAGYGLSDGDQLTAADSLIQNFEIGPEQRPLFLYTAVYEGLFRIYDGTEKWPGGDTRPKLAQLESSGLEENVDFERHYAFGKDSKAVITDAYYSVYGKTDSVEDNEYFSKPDDKIIGPGYILEYIEGKGAYAGQQVFVLHSIAVPVTVQVDDAYKFKSDDPKDQTPDPLFTATLTVDELPEGVTAAPDILDIGCELEILKGPQPKDAEPEAGASADPVSAGGLCRARCRRIV